MIRIREVPGSAAGLRTGALALLFARLPLASYSACSRAKRWAARASISVFASPPAPHATPTPHLLPPYARSQASSFCGILAAWPRTTLPRRRGVQADRIRRGSPCEAKRFCFLHRCNPATWKSRRRASGGRSRGPGAGYDLERCGIQGRAVEAAHPQGRGGEEKDHRHQGALIGGSCRQVNTTSTGQGPLTIVVEKPRPTTPDKRG